MRFFWLTKFEIKVNFVFFVNINLDSLKSWEELIVMKYFIVYLVKDVVCTCKDEIRWDKNTWPLKSRNSFWAKCKSSYELVRKLTNFMRNIYDIFFVNFKLQVLLFFTSHCSIKIYNIFACLHVAIFCNLSFFHLTISH